MKNILAILAILLPFLASAQQTTLTGVAVDGNTGEGLVSTHVILKGQQADSAKVWTAVSDLDGRFEIKNLPYGIYTATLSFIGYQSVEQKVEASKPETDLGTVKLTEGLELSEVQVVETVLPVVLKGDTTQMNAAAYKTNPDASTEDLIKKMPGIVVADGKVQAQGEDVKKVLVDGKPFFGNDPAATLKNLPAEMVDKIQIFDQQSDQAQFSGFDGDETTKTINVITKADKRNGQFGKIYAGYGYKDNYLAGGNLNIFNGSQRISIIGLSNNVNVQNFSHEDLLGVMGSSGRRGPGGSGGGGGPRGPGGGTSSDFMVPQQGGVNASNAAGINFTNEWGDKLEISGSYFFNSTDNNTETSLSRQYFDEEGVVELYNESNEANSLNINHRFSGELEYKINESNQLKWRPSLSFQSNQGEESVFGQTTDSAASLLNQSESDFEADLSMLNFTNSLLWQHSFNKKGRTFSIDLNGGYSPQSGESQLFANNLFDTDTSILDQRSLLDGGKWNVGGNMRYTEPIGEKSRLLLEYSASYQQEESTKETSDYEEATQSYSLYNEDLSNVFSNDYLSQSAGAGYSFKSEKWRFNTRANVQWSELMTEQAAPYAASTNKTFTNVLPSASLSYQTSKTNRISLHYRTRTQLPSLSQLQNVVDNSNPLQLKTGNPDLSQGYQHSIFARYSRANPEKSSTFFAMLGSEFAGNYVSSNTYLSAADYDPSLEADAQISVPVNLGGYRSLRGFATYGFPLSFVKSNLNLDASASHTRTPSLVNGLENFSKTSRLGLGLTLSSNISENVDFTLRTRSSLNFTRNSLSASTNTKYFNQSSNFSFNWLMPKGFVFKTDLDHNFYGGLDESFNPNYFIWNASIGKKLLKDNRLEVSLAAYDLLNQNSAVSRSTTETFVEDRQTNALQRYVMLNVKYDLKNFKIK